MLSYEQITCAVRFCGSHLEPPLIRATPLVLLPSQDLIPWPILDIKPSLTIELNLKEKSIIKILLKFKIVKSKARIIYGAGFSSSSCLYHPFVFHWETCIWAGPQELEWMMLIGEHYATLKKTILTTNTRHAYFNLNLKSSWIMVTVANRAFYFLKTWSNLTLTKLINSKQLPSWLSSSKIPEF